LRAFSTRITHDAQVMPPMPISMVVGELVSVVMAQA
jgi:hypothetical protein